MKYLGKELERFSTQIQFSNDHYKAHGIHRKDIDHIIIAGLGGSGIAGRIVKNYFHDKIDLPMEVSSDYTLARYAGKRTLIILSSYSGDTEETLSMYDLAKEKGCPIIVLTTGGQLLQRAKADGHIVYLAEPGLQPRAALGYSITNLFLIVFELMGLDKKAELKKISQEMSAVEDFKSVTANYMKTFKNTPTHKYIIYCDPFFEGIAIRFAQQIEENSKLEAFVHVIPEANHNVLETYYHTLESNFIFINSGQNQRNNLRFFFVKELLEKLKVPMVEVKCVDASMNAIFRMIYELDWLSLQIADTVGAISNTVPNISELKKFLQKA